MAKNSLECHGDKFADVIVCIYWRQVRRSDKYLGYVMLQRLGSHSLKEISIFISDTFAERCYVLIFDITWMMDISLNDTSLFGLFIYERHFLPGHVGRKKRSADDVLFEYTVRLDSDLCRKTLSLRLLFINVD